jgi:hypothetical protein
MVAPKSALELEDPHVSGITSLHPEILKENISQICPTIMLPSGNLTHGDFP